MSERVDEVCWHCWSIAISIDIYIGFNIYNDFDIDIDIDIDIGGKDVVESASSILTLLHYCSLSLSLSPTQMDTIGHQPNIWFRN